MQLPTPRPGTLRRVEEWSTGRRAWALTVYAVAAVVAAFLWPVALGGCTALDVVPTGAAGGGLAGGDVVVTRCVAPDVGDRVVHRAADAGWSVGQVVGARADGWQVRGDDGVGRDVPARPDALDVLSVHVPGEVASTAAAGAVVAVVVAVVVLHRRPVRGV